MEINADGDVVWLGVASVEALPEDPMRGGWEQFQSRWPNEVFNLDQYRVLPMTEIAAEAARKFSEGLDTPNMTQIAAEAARKFSEGLDTPNMTQIAAEVQRKLVDAIASDFTATAAVADIQRKVVDAWTVKFMTDAMSERDEAREVPPPDVPDLDGGAIDDGDKPPEIKE
ncbi:hypothetical protein A5681_04540 [Mycobacterium scrofulaceum]|nr:hypothetical protein A5681_04540 [Mycobacterium scrofulaceum]